MSKDEIKDNFVGNIYTLTDNWLSSIPLPTGPIKYLEIGAYYGANICSIVKTYATHDESEIHCVDPWTDYKEYHEYKSQQPNIYSGFIQNISKLPEKDIHKIHIHRGFSGDILPKFQNEMFDIIYIDGNHDAPFVLEDAVVSFKKLKSGGWLIFDDVTWDGVNASLYSFINSFGSHFEKPITLPGIQCVMKKK